MLIANFTSRSVRVNRSDRQRGVVLLMALIMLVVLTLAGIALVRSVSTTNVIAGNLAFKQATTNSADVGIEDAITWLEANNTGVTLQTDAATRYLAARQDPAAGQSWEAFWATIPTASIFTLASSPDAAGNTVQYVIHRLCNSTGVPASSGCSAAPVEAAQEGGSQGGGQTAIRPDPQIYYRITARVTGPRNTVSFVQAIVSL